jgi:hypothetical protein
VCLCRGSSPAGCRGCDRSRRPAERTLEVKIRTSVQARRSTLSGPMSPFWIWTQALIVLFVLAGMIIAVTKLV